MRDICVPVVIFALLVGAAPASAVFVSFDILNACIIPLDSDSYRLRVETDWHAWDLADDQFVSFYAFGMGPLLGDCQYNPSQNAYAGGSENHPGYWAMTWAEKGSLLPIFEYDFDTSVGIGNAPIAQTYGAGFCLWHVCFDGPIWLEDELYLGGSFDALLVPEPATVALLVFGLAASVGALRRRRALACSSGLGR